MSIGILRVLRALLWSVLLSVICLLLLAAFAATRDAPEALVAGCGRGVLFFAALMAGFLGARSNENVLGGMLSATLLLLLVLLCAPLFGSTAPTEKWVLLGISLTCGLVGSLVGGKRRAKVIRRKKRVKKR